MASSGQGDAPFKTAWAANGTALLYRKIQFQDRDDAEAVIFTDYFFGTPVAPPSVTLQPTMLLMGCG